MSVHRSVQCVHVFSCKELLYLSDLLLVMNFRIAGVWFSQLKMLGFEDRMEVLGHQDSMSVHKQQVRGLR